MDPRIRGDDSVPYSHHRERWYRVSSVLKEDGGAPRAAVLVAKLRLDRGYFIARVTHSSETFLL
jgi:hypothetical protein